MKRTELDILTCGELVAGGMTTLEVEQIAKIPHSTTHWLIMNKLEELDRGLYDACVITLANHRSNGGRKVNKEFV